MFTLTDEEKATIEKRGQLQAERDGKMLQLRRYVHLDDTNADRFREEITLLDRQLIDLADSEPAQLAALKEGFNKVIGAAFPVNLSAALALAEQTFELLQSESGQRATALVHRATLTALRAGADPEFHAARAAISAARYKALSDAGLPEALIHALMVAEASRPLPAIPAASASRK